MICAADLLNTNVKMEQKCETASGLLNKVKKKAKTHYKNKQVEL